MNLKDWLDKGWLSEHRPTATEIADLIALADRDLKDCQAGDLSAHWKLAIAYNAGLQMATAALVFTLPPAMFRGDLKLETCDMWPETCVG